MSTDLTWTPDTARLDSLELWQRNPKRLSKAKAARLRASLEEMQQYQPIAVTLNSGGRDLGRNPAACSVSSPPAYNPKG